MTQYTFAKKRLTLVATGFFTLLTLGFAQNEATAQSQKTKLREDVRTCESFGARYGTPAFTDCMLDQQQRRDTKKLRDLEESERLSQLAKDSQLMAERARRQRCDRNPERRECRKR
ncbi:hypothetical protein [Sphingopyxis sp. JAI108]|uniref:hypothetical protein n=1 Tax=Sphingopyxis sp. JAI108 TaxID=2723060 RepID=UPI0015CBE896|nr:hypothetical protein [Sphingopyxis sp. JAI108]NYF30733.1 hypothetical protein [Sphingopyxis sp. JAI108]